MKNASNRTEKFQTAASAAPDLRPNSGHASYLRKLDAVDCLARDILSRLEKIVQEDPVALMRKQSVVLRQELRDNQAYFLQKIVHAKDTLDKISTLLQIKPESSELRERVSAELMLLFVLIETYRPERMEESGWNLDEDKASEIREKIESLGLDVINIRERLK